MGSIDAISKLGRALLGKLVSESHHAADLQHALIGPLGTGLKL
jgi:hypothetical protein